MSHIAPPKKEKERLKIASPAPDETFELGREIGARATGGEVIGLIGPLGAGKTELVKGIAKGLGVLDSYISSPTFILVHPYQGRLPFYHLDLFRIEKEEAWLSEYIETEGVCAVEWADRGLLFLPEDRLTVEMRYAGGDRREIALTASTPHFKEWIKELKESRRWKIIEN